MERIYERLERLERSQAEHNAAISELRRRVDGVERIVDDIHELRNAITRLEGRLEAMISRTAAWQTIVWALLALIVSGFVGAGFRLLGGP